MSDDPKLDTESVHRGYCTLWAMWGFAAGFLAAALLFTAMLKL